MCINYDWDELIHNQMIFIHWCLHLGWQPKIIQSNNFNNWLWTSQWGLHQKIVFAKIWDTAIQQGSKLWLPNNPTIQYIITNDCLVWIYIFIGNGDFNADILLYITLPHCISYDSHYYYIISLQEVGKVEISSAKIRRIHNSFIEIFNIQMYTSAARKTALYKKDDATGCKK